MAALFLCCVGLIEWRSLPHVDRASALKTAAAAAFGGAPALARAFDMPPGRPAAPRTAAAIDSWGAIPVWPAWPTPTSPIGGRVRPIMPDPKLADPFLLLAHHRHSFSPNDPLRGPFRTVGGALGLPYVGEEGFKLHPHRGLDIFTIVLDGSDGFRHRDSLGGECVYRGGACQFMRAGRGVMHEEFWETRSDRPTKIELFQLWVNLPSKLKMSPPAIRYIGDEWGTSYGESAYVDASSGVRTRVRTIDGPTLEAAVKGEGDVLAPRPAVQIRHATIGPGGAWVAPADAHHTAMAYVRSGTVLVNGQVLGEAKAGSTCTFNMDGDTTWLVNANRAEPADVLLLTGAPLREPVALGGPIVMNYEAEIQKAYAELRAGTFLG